MEIKNIIILFLILILVFNCSTYSQSDYEKLQSFKKQYNELEERIKNASTLDECVKIGDDISNLRSYFIVDKDLLDKSLYPENFETALSKIEKTLEIRKLDFIQIFELTTEVGTLKSSITELSEKNRSLIAEIRELTLKSEKDASTIATLQKLVAQLKSNIQQRDILVRDIVDSLFVEFERAASTLTETERQDIISKIDSKDLFYNIERTIADNIQFIRVTQLQPEDLSEMKKQFADFNRIWKQIGSKLGEVYLSKKEKAQEIASIDEMFSEWNSRINDEIWTQVNKLFREKQISLLSFRNGESFVNSINSFVDDEIKNLGVKRQDETEKVFFTFIDSVYFKSIKPVWIPILIENKMMTETDKDSIESRISFWKEKVLPEKTFNWLYIILVGIIIVLLIAYFMKGKRSNS